MSGFQESTQQWKNMLVNVVDAKQPQPKGPWERVSMDFVGPLPNKDMILVL
jgi:hypothetical protein